MLPEKKRTTFEAKGLGWIPDYPDARDYQLSNEIFEKLQKVTGQDYFEGINLLLRQLKERLDRLSTQDADANHLLNHLEQELEKFDFPQVKVYRVLQPGSEGEEVTLLKYCLTRFYQEELQDFKPYLEPLNSEAFESENYCNLQAIRYLCDRLGEELNFLEGTQENWEWLSQMTFDQPGTKQTATLVEAFQTWAGISVDGKVGIDTYTALEDWMSRSKTAPKRRKADIDSSSSQKLSLPIPFPAPVPANLLQTILRKLLAQNGEQLCQNATFEQHVEEIAQKYFLLIEPIISVITEMLGPVGAYQKIEAAIEAAVKKFLFLLDLETESYLSKLRHLPNLASVSSSEEFERFQLLEDLQQNLTVLDLKFLGSSEQIPDYLVSELHEDLNNLRHLKETAQKAINTCRFRLGKELGKEALDNTRTVNSEEELDPSTLICKILQGISRQLPEKDREGDIFNKSIVLELVRKPSILEKDQPKESHSPRFFSDYRIPSGASLLKNLRNTWEDYLPKAGDAEKDTSKDWKACWQEKADSIKVFTYLPDSVDLSFWCSPISDQGTLKSCAAHAGAALVEYFSKRYHNDYKPVSTRFLYKIARNLMERKGDTGSSLRETIKAMVTFGIPPEAYWRYEEDNFDEEPTSFCYSFAQNYQTLSYFRLDHPNISHHELLTRIKIALAAGFPCMFGLTIHQSIYSPFNVKRGYIPYPGKPAQNLAQPDEVISGHAVVAVGYHDYKQIKHSNSDERSTGAILIRNSWGTQWGLSGYGWLPYDYVLNGLTADWWSLVESKWLETGKFGLGGTKDYGEVPGPQKGR